MRNIFIAVLAIFFAFMQAIGPSRNQSFNRHANAQENVSFVENAKSTVSSDLPTMDEARRQAKILHTAMHSTLQIVHHRYYKEDQSMPLPAATLKDVFAELQEEQGISLRWLAIDGKAMNVTHEPQNTFETQAAQALKSGKDEFEQTENGVYRRVGPIQLSNVCLKCHVSDRKSLENRVAGLIIGIPVKE